MYCGKCGSKLENDATFCPYCGNKIDENKAEDLHLTNGFIKCKKFNSKCHMRYKEDNDCITFYNNCLFYSKEFNSFFLYDHFANDLKIIKEIFDKIKETNPEINIKEEKL